MKNEITTQAPADPLRVVVGWVIAGHGEADIRDAISTTWPDAKARPLILAAVKYLAAAGSPDPEVIRGFAIEGTRQIYRKAIEIGDLQTGLRALKQLVTLGG